MRAGALERIGGAAWMAALCAGWPDRPCDLPEWCETMSAFKRRRRAMRDWDAEAHAPGPPLGVTTGRAARGVVRAGRGGERMGREVPRELVVWAGRGLASARQLCAAERFVSDWEAGHLGALRGTNYAERVDGGTLAEPDVLRGIRARERCAAAMAALGPLAGPLKGWLVDGVSAVGSVETANNFQDPKRARGAAAGVLLTGLEALASFYA